MYDYARLKNRQRGSIGKVVTHHSDEYRNPGDTAHKLNAGDMRIEYRASLLPQGEKQDEEIRKLWRDTRSRSH
jgi:hypothetical protein